MSKPHSQKFPFFWIFFAFAIWIFAFRGFLSSRLELTSDALSYYEHTKFFILNLGHGVYPLWDPFWFSGAPNDFFLRRIGAFNPFYLIILIFKTVGIPYTLSYLGFLAIYYWGGMVAFYLLAMHLYQDRLLAYGGYLLLLFSALGTRLFDSYMMLVTVPLIWFFYFLVAFNQTPRKHLFLGMVLALMVLSGTYIPFYFLIIICLCAVVFIFVYFKEIPGILRCYANFFKENKILTVLGIMAIGLSFLPTLNFFMDSAKGHVVMPIRHGGAGTGAQLLTVPRQTLDWGAVEDLMYSSYFSNLKLYKFAVVYVPFFVFIPLCLGLIGRINRRAVLIFMVGIILFCSIVPHGLPLYDFFYDHLLILKYFRNLHFFLWFFLIPLFVLLALEHWNLFKEIMAQGKYKKPLLIWVMCVHLAAAVFVWWRGDAVVSTYIMLGLSLIFWILMVLNKLEGNNAWGFGLLTLAILIQPLEAYHYLALNALRHTGEYTYSFPLTTLKMKDNAFVNTDAGKDTLYYASAGYNFVDQNISNAALAKYLSHKIILVDHVQIADQQSAVSLIEHNFLTNANVAVITSPADEIKLDGDDPHPSDQAQPVGPLHQFKILSFNANHLKIRLDLPYKKFLVYNDSYDPGWKVTINGHKALLSQVNGAFKGTWLPAGRSVVEFSYGSIGQYALNILLSCIAVLFVAGIVVYACLS